MAASRLLRGRVRPLREDEIAEARKVFRDQLCYERVRVHEGTAWPNFVDRIGRRLKGIKGPPKDNAITLGYHCFFPVQLHTQDRADRLWLRDMGWLMHELTHAWQFEHMGWRYVFLALYAQFKLGAHAYDLPRAEELPGLHDNGWTLASFNLEQQGEVMRNYFWSLQAAAGDRIAAYGRFVNDIHPGGGDQPTIV